MYLYVWKHGIGWNAGGVTINQDDKAVVNGVEEKKKQVEIDKVTNTQV